MCRHASQTHKWRVLCAYDGCADMRVLSASLRPHRCKSSSKSISNSIITTTIADNCSEARIGPMSRGPCALKAKLSTTPGTHLLQAKLSTQLKLLLHMNTMASRRWDAHLAHARTRTHTSTSIHTHTHDSVTRSRVAGSSGRYIIIPTQLKTCAEACIVRTLTCTCMYAHIYLHG